jgi:hypothetical protein
MRWLVGLLIVGCTTDLEDTGEKTLRGAEPEVQSPTNTLAQLTDAQFRNTIETLFGEGIALPTQLIFIDDVEGLEAVGASVSSVSPLGAERFEMAAYQIAAQVLDPEGESFVDIGCVPEESQDTDCALVAARSLGERVWRRPLTNAEQEAIAGLTIEAAAVFDDFYQGLEFGLAAMLMSPNFIYRPELGDDGRLSAFELATRLSYFLWNTMPDDDLLDVAADESLLEAAVLEAHVDRMMADPRIVQGLDAFFGDLYDLNLLDEMSKDPLIYKHMNSELPSAARQETLRVISDIVVDRNADFRELFTTQRAWVDRRLAAIYDVQAPEMEGFGWVDLPKANGRRGLLGHASILSLYAHAVSSSVTLRGIFVRERVLCHDIPAPPADVNTAIPESSDALPTMRERVAQHLEDPACANCHEMTDLIGLGLENFDGIARWRSSENGHEINPSGELDGAAYADAWKLAAELAKHPDVGPCLSNQLFAYATHHTPKWTERSTMEWHSEGFEESGYRVAFLMRDIALSAAFSSATPVEQDE